MISKLFNIAVLMILFSASPIVMDEARDIYLAQIVSKKAHPVKYNTLLGERTIGSSWQVLYRGVRLTVTNNHVCKVLEKRRRGGAINLIPNLPRFSKKPTKPEKPKKPKFTLIGKSLKIGSLNRKILYVSKNHDICILEPYGTAYFKLAKFVQRGERITIIGHPRGLPQSISDGRVVGSSQKEMPWLPEAGIVTVLRSTAASYPGNSGSPAINRWGRVIGMLFAGYSVDYVNINYLVPLDSIRSELEAFIQQY